MFKIGSKREGFVDSFSLTKIQILKAGEKTDKDTNELVAWVRVLLVDLGRKIMLNTALFNEPDNYKGLVKADGTEVTSLSAGDSVNAKESYKWALSDGKLYCAVA